MFCNFILRGDPGFYMPREMPIYRPALAVLIAFALIAGPWAILLSLAGWAFGWF